MPSPFKDTWKSYSCITACLYYVITSVAYNIILSLTRIKILFEFTFTFYMQATCSHFRGHTSREKLITRWLHTGRNMLNSFQFHIHNNLVILIFVYTIYIFYVICFSSRVVYSLSFSVDVWYIFFISYQIYTFKSFAYLFEKILHEKSKIFLYCKMLDIIICWCAHGMYNIQYVLYIQYLIHTIPNTYILNT